MEDEQQNILANRFLFISILVIILMTGAFFAGVATGSDLNDQSAADVSGLKNKVEDKPENVDFSVFWETWKALEANHIKGSEVSTQERVWEAAKGLTRAYDDPNTVFMPPKESEKFESDISGQFEGVGMEVGERDEAITVVAPLQGTPAEEAGVESGDKIIEIDGESTKGITVEEAVDLIRGEKGTEVELSILREGEDEPLEISIVRGVIDIPTIETELREDGVFVIRLFNFAGQSVSKFGEAIREFNNSGSDKLIVDLRNNPGGYLQASVEVASYFLKEGEVVLREKFSDDREEKVYRSKGYRPSISDPDMVILINGGSASASEIVAGALSDHGIATTIGSQTFGKGSVQEVMEIGSDTSLKVTIAEWLTPEGHSFEGEGIEPDIEVELTEEEYQEGVDPQFDKALESLLNDE
ncbi:MAG: S41 family peptidase [Candidatus Paceibacterota bacterium]